MVLHLAARFERRVLEWFDALLDRTGGALFGPGGREQGRQQHAGTERDQTGRQGIAPPSAAHCGLAPLSDPPRADPFTERVQRDIDVITDALDVRRL